MRVMCWNNISKPWHYDFNCLLLYTVGFIGQRQMPPLENPINAVNNVPRRQDGGIAIYSQSLDKNKEAFSCVECL